MKTAVISFLVLGIVLLIGSGCYYDVDDELNPKTDSTLNCDTSALNYIAIKSVFENGNCLGCHSGANADAGLDFSTYASASQYLTSSSSTLIDRITVGNTGDIMPPIGPKLNDCNVSQIKAWINAGYPQ
jgi:hypothetical protein